VGLGAKKFFTLRFFIPPQISHLRGFLPLPTVVTRVNIAFFKIYLNFSFFYPALTVGPSFKFFMYSFFLHRFYTCVALLPLPTVATIRSIRCKKTYSLTNPLLPLKKIFYVTGTALNSDILFRLFKLRRSFFF
jgi:hypothetical protein